MLKRLDIDLAGDFLVMAATLMEIKSAMLLPRPELEDSEDDQGDPRAELIRQLLEYKRFKDAANLLSESAEQRKERHSRPVVDHHFPAKRTSARTKTASHAQPSQRINRKATLLRPSETSSGPRRRVFPGQRLPEATCCQNRRHRWPGLGRVEGFRYSQGLVLSSLEGLGCCTQPRSIRTHSR